MPFLFIAIIGTAAILTAVIIRQVLRFRRLQLLYSGPPLIPTGEKFVSPLESNPLPGPGQPLPEFIIRPDTSSMDRGDWVQRLTHHVFAQRHARRFNVLTIHTNIDYNFAPSGLLERMSVEYQDAVKARIIPYEVIVFQRGQLVRLGDGGYDNWCFQGNFDRTDEFVTFKDIE